MGRLAELAMPQRDDILGQRWGRHGDDMLSFAQPRAVESLVETTHLPPPEHQKRVASAVVNVSKFCECCFLTI